MGGGDENKGAGIQEPTTVPWIGDCARERCRASGREEENKVPGKKKVE